MISDTTQPRIYKGQPIRRFVTSFGVVVGAGLLWIASGLLIPDAFLGLSGQLRGLVTIFLGIFIEALPFLLAGVLAASAIHLFVSPEQVQRLCPRAPVPAALTGALLGLVFPVCECGSVPTARRLIAKGAPLPMGVAFVL
ncbi:MAG: permease, partial [Chloroflexota bacterium]